MTVFRVVTFLVAALILGGCARTLASSPASITISGVNTFTLDDAYAEAQAHCSKYGKNAQLIPDAHKDGITTFNCVE